MKSFWGTDAENKLSACNNDEDDEDDEIIASDTLERKSENTEICFYWGHIREYMEKNGIEETAMCVC